MQCSLAPLLDSSLHERDDASGRPPRASGNRLSKQFCVGTSTAAVAAPWESPESRQLMLLDSCTLMTVTVVFPYTKHII